MTQRHRAGIGLVALALAVAFAPADAVPEPPVVTLKRLDDAGALHPGDRVRLALEWPAGARPAEVRTDIGTAAPPPPATPSTSPNTLLPIAFTPRSTPGAAGAAGSTAPASNVDVIDALCVGLGTLELPPLELRDGTGKVVARTASFKVDVKAAVTDKEAKPAPSRPAVSIPLDMAGLILVGALALAIIAAAVWGFVRWRRSRRPYTAAKPAAPPVPPHERALRALDELIATPLLVRGELKAFSVRLAEIGKDYVGEVTGTPLLEATTTECRHLLRRTSLTDERRRWMVSWLESLDLVKFAGDRPPAEALADAAEALRQVILELRPQIAPTEPVAAAAVERAS